MLLDNVQTQIFSFVVGEVGLAGEVRHASHISQRLSEAERLGFTHAIVPSRTARDLTKLTCRTVNTLNEALAHVGLTSSVSD